MHHTLKYLIYSLIIIFVTACGGGGGGAAAVPVPVAATIKISWNSNPETAVNRTDGGYKVYYSSNSGFAISDSGVTQVDVPYSSGVTAPTSTQLQLFSGTYYIRIIAYSALDAPGTSGGSVSTATPQTTLVVP